MAIALKIAGGEGCCDCDQMNGCECTGVPCARTCRARAGTAELCGFDEFEASLPPKKYRRRTKNGVMFSCAFPSADCTVPTPNTWAGGGRLTSNTGSYGGSLTPIDFRGTDCWVKYRAEVEVIFDSHRIDFTHSHPVANGINRISGYIARPSRTQLKSEGAIVHEVTNPQVPCSGGFPTVDWFWRNGQSTVSGSDSAIYSECGGGEWNFSAAFPANDAAAITFWYASKNILLINSQIFLPPPPYQLRLVSPAGSAFDVVMQNGEEKFIDPAHGPYAIWIEVNGTLDTFAGTLAPGIRQAFRDEWAALDLYNATTCVITSSGQRERYSQPNGPCPLRAGGVLSGEPPTQYLGAGLSIVTEPTVRVTRGNGVCVAGAPCGSIQYISDEEEDEVVEELLEEDTENDAIARETLGELWSVGECRDLTAFRTLRGAGQFSFGFREVEVKVTLGTALKPLIIGHSYEVTVRYTRRLLGSSGPFIFFAQDQLTIVADAMIEETDWLDVPSEAGWETRAESCSVEDVTPL